MTSERNLSVTDQPRMNFSKSTSGSLIPTPSKSTSHSLLPRPVVPNSSTSNRSGRHPSASARKQRATVTPTVNHRRRTSSSSSGSTSVGWLTSLLSTLPSKKKVCQMNNIHSVIRVSLENGKLSDGYGWQATDTSFWYLGPKSIKKYEFDHVFRENNTNKDVFDTSVKSAVQGVVDGYSATLFTYGQPRTGKTHTMNTNYQYIISLSYFEIANETIRDLLADPFDVLQKESLKISDSNKRRGAFVAGLTEKIVRTPSEAVNYFQKGEANRYIISNNYDSHHSKSHTFLQVSIERRKKQNNNILTRKPSSSSLISSSSSSTRKTVTPKSNSQPNAQVSHLYIIDMASNEKSIFQPTKNPVNKSCLTFEAIVHNLSEQKKSAGHPLPPYHDSKLTRLLQPSFMGQSHVVSICTVDMELASQDEFPTLETLNLASRIRKIPVSPKTMEITEDKSLLAKYSKNINQLYQKVTKIEQLNSNSNRQDLERIKIMLQQRIHEQSRFILSSESDFENRTLSNEEENADPWKIISDLRKELDSSQYSRHLQSVSEESKNLPDEIAQLEAELNITKAELKVTQLLVRERDSLHLSSSLVA